MGERPNGRQNRPTVTSNYDGPTVTSDPFENERGTAWELLAAPRPPARPQGVSGRSPTPSNPTAPANADLLRQSRAHLRQDEVAQDSQNSSLERELRLGANPQSQHVVLRLTFLAVPDRFLFGGSVCVG